MKAAIMAACSHPGKARNSVWKIPDYKFTYSPPRTDRTDRGMEILSDRDFLLEIDVLNGIQQFDTLRHRFLEGFTAADQA